MISINTAVKECVTAYYDEASSEEEVCQEEAKRLLSDEEPISQFSEEDASPSCKKE